MPQMIPPMARQGANKSEEQIFHAMAGITNRDDWVVIHSLQIARHKTAFTGEVDFIVLVPGKGIAIVEAKAPRSAQYQNGEWFLEGTPSPKTNPLQQLDGVRRSLRGYLKELGLLTGNEPIARLVWFTSLQRHDFEQSGGSGMQLFEWELAWQGDLKKPTWLIEKLFDEHNAWYGKNETVEHDPESFTLERVQEIKHALLGNFHVTEAIADRIQERHVLEASLLAEQDIVLELFENNDHVYLDGPAGTGKSHLISLAAKNYNRAGAPTLVACWNLLMAEEFQKQLGALSNVDVYDLNSLMLKVSGLEVNPKGATDEWYTETLPQLASQSLQKNSAFQYVAILVDEFQDIASSENIIEFLQSLSRGQSKIMLAGDSRQQIMRKNCEQVDAFAVAKNLVPEIVHVRLARNCRNAPAIIEGAQKLMPRAPFGFTGFRMPTSVPSSFTVRDASKNETGVLIDTIRELLKEFSPQEIVILSPFAESNSTVGKFLSREPQTRGERWLLEQLEREGGDGKIRWRSVFKFKGLDADAVILTDIGETAKNFTSERDLNLSNLLYVGVTRAKYKCFVLTSD